MQKISFLIVMLCSVIFLAGCGEKHKNAMIGNGGVYKSSDAGETFHLTSIVSKEKSLSNASILDLEISPLDPNIIYAATASYGIYRTSNGGQSWAESKSDFTYVRKIALDPTNKNIIYIIANKDNERALFKTTDGGINWKKLLAQRNSKTPRMVDIIIDKNNSNILYTTDTTGGVFKSTDAGKEWAAIYWANDPVKKVLLDAKNSQRIYLLTTTDEVYVSDNGGSSFKISESEDGFDEIYSISVNQSEPGFLYVLSRKGLQVTKDGGKTYKNINTLLPPENTVAHEVVTDPINKDILYLVAGKIIYKTTNSGKTWTAIPLKIKWPVKSFVIDYQNHNNIYMGLSKPPKKQSNFLFPF